MKYLFALLSLVSFSLLQAQKTGETVYVKDIDCVYDTVSSIQENATLYIDEANNKALSTLIEGENRILITKVFTKECQCADCGESFQFAFILDSLEMNKTANLTSKQLTWVYSNSWIQPKFITSYLGNITMTDKNTFVIKISELLGTSVIRTINLNVKVN